VIRWLLDRLYGSQPADFDSEFALEESVERLASSTKRTIFDVVVDVITHEAAVGDVSQTCVSLQRIRSPFVNTISTTLYKGRFIERNGKVLLSGRFTRSWGVKLFFTISIVILTIWTVAIAAALSLDDPATWWLPCVGVGMIAALIFSKKLPQNDVSWLSNVIQQALFKKESDFELKAGPELYPDVQCDVRPHRVQP
jgi:hypothetical protein